MFYFIDFLLRLAREVQLVISMENNGFELIYRLNKCYLTTHCLKDGN